MTIYEYSCRYCHHHFELPVRITEKELKRTKCLNTACGRYGLSRVYGVLSIHFKGTGYTRKIG